MTVRASRPALAVLVVAVALSGAFALHGHRVQYRTLCFPGDASGAAANSYNPCVRERRPGWVDPTALGMIMLGAAVAIGVVAGRGRKRRSIPADACLAVLIVGGGLIGAYTLHYQTSRSVYYGGNSTVIPFPGKLHPGWADPAAVAALVLGVVGACGVAAARGRNRKSAQT